LNSTFENISEEKRQKIIAVCLEEFATKGYESASTNSMVKKAEISKGLLFHYFGSKKNLYLYLLDIAIDCFIGKFYSYYTKPNSDVFERIIQRGIIKIKISSEEPLMSKLVMEAFIDTPQGMKEEMDSRFKKLYSENMPTVAEDVDYSLFRDDIDTQKAMEFMMLCFDALYNKYTNKFKGKALALSNEEIDNMVKEYYEFLDMMKFGMYKKKL
jgi:TetR/AcrR family transcriptional regulator